ncbi:hypothetical protein [Atlantibacter sp.]|uniref:hypothetical protein n=1 Tax=Atlantibacter sp. TaxID=1903473 RepID=UPI0028A00716|nr:hypothetical protein [Atlantibacter sp.]
MRLVTMLLLFFGCLSSAPIYARDTLSRSCGLIVNAGNNNYLYYTNGRIKELLLNRKGKGLMAKTHSCACISYRGNDNKIQRINNVSFNHKGSCYKDIGNVYASDYAYGKTPGKLSGDKGNKVYLAYNYIPDRENRLFFFHNEMTTFYIFEKYGEIYVKSEVCTQNKTKMHCRRYYESGPEIGRLSEEKNYIDMEGNYIEEGKHILYDSDGR